MTQDEIIEMARQAGGIDITNTLAKNSAWIGTGTPEFLERFAKLIAEKEREACAGSCDVQALTVAASAEVCAEAIRARSKE